VPQLPREILTIGVDILQYAQMADGKRTRFQIDASVELRKLAKKVAGRHDQSLTEYVLLAIAATAKKEDKDLYDLIIKELAEKQPPGRPYPQK